MRRHLTGSLVACLTALLLGSGALAAGSAAGSAPEGQAETQAPASAEGGSTDTKELSPVEQLTQKPNEVTGQGNPIKERQFVYSLSPWTGKEWGGTFDPRQIDRMFLTAGVQNVINSLRTDVYFWAITGEYMADWFGFKEEVPGKLEVYQGDKLVASLEKTDYVYSYPEGYGGSTQLVTGPAAQTAFQSYEKAMDDYWSAVSKYYDEYDAYQKKMDALLKRVQQTKVPAKPAEIPQAPQQAEPPKLYVTQPVQGFLVNLPAGDYRVRLVANDGKVVEGSEKRLTFFDARREGVGYEVLPESKWTRQTNSDDLSQVLYLDGRRVFYAKPFQEKEFNVYQYAKMAKLHVPLEGEGARSAWAWVHTTEVPETATLQVLRDGQVFQEIKRQGYYVEQTPGYALGYNIVEFNPEEPSMAGREPSFEAYRVELESGSYQLRMVDADGQVLPGSLRSIRAVRAEPAWPLYAIPLIPMIIGLVVFGWRRSLRPRQRSTGGHLPAPQVAATHERID